MKRGGGIKNLDDKSSGMEILMSEAFAKIKPTDPLILAKQAARRKRKVTDSSDKKKLTFFNDSGMSLAKADASRYSSTLLHRLSFFLFFSLIVRTTRINNSEQSFKCKAGLPTCRRRLGAEVAS